MKQKDIVVGKEYILTRMEYIGKADLNGMLVTITGQRRRGKGPVYDSFGNVVGHGERPIKYFTSIPGLFVSATNILEEWK